MPKPKLDQTKFKILDLDNFLWNSKEENESLSLNGNKNAIV